MNKCKQISREDLLTIQNARANVNYQKALTDNAELQARNIVLMTFMKYGLSTNDGIDFTNGQIIWAETELDEELMKQEEARRTVSSGGTLTSDEMLEEYQTKEDNETK